MVRASNHTLEKTDGAREQRMVFQIESAAVAFVASFTRYTDSDHGWVRDYSHRVSTENARETYKSCVDKGFVSA